MKTRGDFQSASDRLDAYRIANREPAMVRGSQGIGSVQSFYQENKDSIIKVGTAMAAIFLLVSIFDTVKK